MFFKPIYPLLRSVGLEVQKVDFVSKNVQKYEISEPKNLKNEVVFPQKSMKFGLEKPPTHSKWFKYSSRVPKRHIDQQFAYLFRHRLAFFKLNFNFLHWEKLISLRPWFQESWKAKRQSDARLFLCSLRTGKKLEIASELYWNRLDVILEYSEQHFWILEKIC